MGLSDFFKPIPKPGTLVPGSPAPAVLAPARPVSDGLAFLKARANLAFEDHHPDEAAEIRRICSLVAHYAISPEELEAVCAQELHAAAYESGFRLHPEQAAILLAYDENSRIVSPESPYGIGCFGPIGCGRGKTLATQMLAYRAFLRGVERSVLLVPASVVAQFFRPDLPWARSKVPLDRLQFYNLSALDTDSRRALIRSRKTGCYVLSFELLSQAEQTELLEQIEPGLILVDEAHNLANKTSSRTKRVKRYAESHFPQMVSFSGTMTGKSVEDYGHIIKWCLRLRSPLPTATTLLKEWAMVLDADAQPTKAQALKLRPLVEWARPVFPRCLSCHGLGRKTVRDDDGTESVQTCRACNGSGKTLFTEDVAGYRKAYTLRLNSAPGVVSSPEDVVGTALVIENKPIEDYQNAAGWPELHQFMLNVGKPLMITPGGEEIDHAIHCYKWLYELSAGFYNELFWPTADVIAKRRGMSDTNAKDLLEKSQKHLAAQQLYTSELRFWLSEYARPKLDSPFLLGGHMKAKGAPPNGEELYRLWKLMKALDFPGRLERDSRAVRVCSYKVDHAVKWAKSLDGEGAIVWYYNDELGSWLVEALRAAGIDTFHAHAGPAVNEELRHTPENVARHGKQIVVASWKAHGTGKNLQWFWNQLVIQWPRAAKLAEQMIARTHREGQAKDEITLTLTNTTPFDHANFSACLNDATYIHQTGGGRQRLLYSRYPTLPRIYPSEWLRQHGFEVEILTKEQEAALQEKFGRMVTPEQ